MLQTGILSFILNHSGDNHIILFYIYLNNKYFELHMLQFLDCCLGESTKAPEIDLRPGLHAGIGGQVSN